jgi:hypothetical protein
MIIESMNLGINCLIIILDKLGLNKIKNRFNNVFQSKNEEYGSV